MNITTDMYHKVFNFALQVREGSLSSKQATLYLVNETGMNLSSASGYINVVGKLKSGQV